MPQANRGSKRHCSHCGANFYDLDRSPITCPKCHHDFVPTARLPSGRPARAAAAAAVVAPRLAEAVDDQFEDEEAINQGEGEHDTDEHEEDEDGERADAPE
jgi:uncharacterized protein (TIGR02300 family)